MDKLPDLKELIDGVKAQCGTGILFWAGMLWFISAFAVVAMMPFLWLWQLAGYDPILILTVSVGGWFAYGLIIATIVSHVNFRKDHS